MNSDPNTCAPGFSAPACKLGIAGRVASAFLDSRLTPLVIVAALALSFFAVLSIPREEEPQILVPMLDVMTAMPGASPQEVA